MVAQLLVSLSLDPEQCLSITHNSSIFTTETNAIITAIQCTMLSKQSTPRNLHQAKKSKFTVSTYTPNIFFSASLPYLQPVKNVIKVSCNHPLYSKWLNYIMILLLAKTPLLPVGYQGISSNAIVAIAAQAALINFSYDSPVIKPWLRLAFVIKLKKVDHPYRYKYITPNKTIYRINSLWLSVKISRCHCHIGNTRSTFKHAFKAENPSFYNPVLKASRSSNSCLTVLIFS